MAEAISKTLQKHKADQEMHRSDALIVKDMEGMEMFTFSVRLSDLGPCQIEMMRKGRGTNTQRRKT